MLGLQVADNFNFIYNIHFQTSVLNIDHPFIYIVLLIMKLLNISSGRTLPLIDGIKQHKI